MEKKLVQPVVNHTLENEQSTHLIHRLALMHSELFLKGLLKRVKNEK
jgi:hypothetical protein